jgi:hypothetical protein
MSFTIEQKTDLESHMICYYSDGVRDHIPLLRVLKVEFATNQQKRELSRRDNRMRRSNIRLQSLKILHLLITSVESKLTVKWECLELLTLK